MTSDPGACGPDEALAVLRDWIAALDGIATTPSLRMSRYSILRHIEERARALVAAAPVEAPDNEWARSMRALLGKHVEVVLQHEPERVAETGVLCVFSDGGEVGLRRDDLSFRWCWPNLECKEVPQ